MNTTQKLTQYGLKVPDILLPKKEIDLSKWAVIACDQYTQDFEYWKNLEDRIGSSPSTLHITLPEVYLESPDRRQKIEQIRKTMKEYRDTSNVFDKEFTACIYIERKTRWDRTRMGLIVAIDLEAYDWKPESKNLIRATEATIIERIPPRMEIRRGAPLDLPHIMLLVNDPTHSLIETLGEKVKNKKPLYTTSLEPDSGSISGWAVNTDNELDFLNQTIENLAKANTEKDGSCFLFAVGDGNHSLATAKAVWEEYKQSHKEDFKTGLLNSNTDPARFALVELVNLYDSGLTFEPIHRVLFDTDIDSLIHFLQQKLGGTISTMHSFEQMQSLVQEKNSTRFGFVTKSKILILDTPDSKLAVSRLQPELDAYLKNNQSVKIDYIHGADEVLRLGSKENALTILLPPIEKDSFFNTISLGGPLPRKSFSMGEADEKRFYLESRALF